MSDVELRVAGQIYRAWTSAQITMSLEAVCPAFSLDVVESSRSPLRIRRGMACDLRYQGHVILTGWVDQVSDSEDATQTSIHVSGRARTCDLVDCSVERPQSQPWVNASVRQIAEDVCAPFGIHVSTASLGADELKPIPFVVPEPGESVADLIGRAARLRGVYLLTTETGGLSIERVATRRAATLERGKHILSSTLEEDGSERYSKITVLCQSGVITENAPQSIQAVAFDPTVTRPRPLVVMADTALAELEERAQWEVNSRAGRGTRLSVRIPGWRNLYFGWHPNVIVRVIDDRRGIDADLAIASVQLSMSLSSGTTAQLDLVDPRTLTREPISEHDFLAST